MCSSPISLSPLLSTAKRRPKDAAGGKDSGDDGSVHSGASHLASFKQFARKFFNNKASDCHKYQRTPIAGPLLKQIWHPGDPEVWGAQSYFKDLCSQNRVSPHSAWSPTG